MHEFLRLTRYDSPEVEREVFVSIDSLIMYEAHRMKDDQAQWQIIGSKLWLCGKASVIVVNEPPYVIRAMLGGHVLEEK